MKLQQVVAAALVGVGVGVGVGALAARASAASAPVQPLPHAPAEDERPVPPPPQSILLKVAPARAPAAAPVAAGGPAIRVPARATFRDLVRLARDHAGRGGDPAPACVLAGGAGGGAGFELRAPVPASAASVGDPPRDLDARLARRAPGTGVGVNLRAPWGSIASVYDLDLVALTPVPPDIARALATVVVATDRGFYGLHAGSVRQSGNTRLMNASDLAAFVRAQAPQADAWVVTAEGDAPVSAVRRALAAIAAPGAPVVLATPLPSETSPGAQAERAPPAATISPDEACAVAATAAGPVLARAVLETITARLRAAAQACADAHPGEGGVVDLVIRVGAKGFGIEVCGATIPALAPAAGRCAVDAFRAVSPATGDRWPDGARIAVALDLPGAPLAPLCEQR
jgi:hypothetical protein